MNRIYLLLLLLILSSCAKIAMPTGGDIDKIPPKMVKSNPEQNTLNFNGSGFELQFDEFVIVQNVNEELLISPPLKRKPDVKASYEKIRVKWDDTLAKNTTYIFDFGSSIADFHESNPMNGFVYSFSTGDYIDTMEFRGRILEAYSLKPVVKKYVMLYSSFNTDVVHNQKPNYITKTDSNGYFAFKNISEGKYQILAIEDNNQNLLYDLPNESIAFSNDLIESQYYNSDTVKRQLPEFYFFTPKDTLMTINSSVLSSKRKLEIVFSAPSTDSLTLDFIFPKVNGLKDENIIYKFNSKKDTLTIWAINELVFDSVKINVRDIALDQNVELYYNKLSKETPKDTFELKAQNQRHKYFEDCLLELPFPIKNDTLLFKAMLISDKDTLEIDCKPYERNPYHYIKIGDKLPSNKKFTVHIREGLFKNAINQVNDSLRFSLDIDGVESYGNLLLKLNDTLNKYKTLIVVLEDNASKELRTQLVKSQDKIEFRNLEEGIYRLKFIDDRNSNGVWDTGDYEQGSLPERVIYYNKSINIKKNWDIEEEWFLE